MLNFPVTASHVNDADSSPVRLARLMPAIAPCMQDAVEQKMGALFAQNKSMLRLVGPAVTASALMFLVPLLLCMWRFALFGLGPVR